MEKKSITKRKTGRPTKYKPEFADIARREALNGAINQDLADQFKVSLATIKVWAKRDPLFLAAVKEGRVCADDAIERSLWQRARGWVGPDDKVFLHEGQPVIVPGYKHYPPDATAMIFWLKNRRPKEWRDKRELTGDGGGPIIMKLVHATDEAL